MVLCTLLLASLNEARGQQRPQPITLRQLEEIAHPTLATGSEVFSFSPRSVSLGRISEDGGIITGHFLMENHGDKPVVIVKATADCGCLKVNFPTKPILAGGVAQINFSYNPKGYPGRLTRSILIYTNLSSTRPSAKLTVEGFVEQSADRSGRFPHSRGAALLKGESVSFRLHGSRQVERILAYNNSDHSLGLTPLMVTLPEGLTFTTDPKRVAPHTEFDIVIGFDPNKWQGGAESFRLIMDGVGAAPKNSVIEIKFKK